MKKLILFISAAILLTACKSKKQETETTSSQLDAELVEEVQAYLTDYSLQYKGFYRLSSDAAWNLNTKIVEGDKTSAEEAANADRDMAGFTGNSENIEMAQNYLAQASKLRPIQVLQLKAILYSAANNPETMAEKVEERIKAENAQTEQLFGFDYQIAGTSVTTNKIDDILKNETELDTRLEAWESSKKVGVVLKEGLANLQELRNETVQGLGYDDYFTYQVSEYGMTRQEMMDLMKNMVKDIWPLYRELHTYARYELAKKYEQDEVPDMLPAHWLPNRWAQDWSGMMDVEGFDLDGILAKKDAKWIVEQAEDFYVSLGFPALPETFYTQSSLYPLPEGADYKKNNHASAWHMDLDKDVRSLMSVEPNAEWYETVHHELGHIYYYMTYTNPDVPILLRGGANRGFHEAMGSLMGLASMQKPFLASRGLLEADMESDETQVLLKEALNYVVFIPFSAGTMTNFEHDLYAENLDKNEYNKTWWNYVAKYQGVAPPSERGEEYCDAASKTHINNDAAQYYDYAISYILLFQWHDHISKNILKQDPHATNYYGNKKVGEFIKTIMYPGASRDWRELMKESLGSELSAKPMLDYFAPLMEYLKKENEGRKYTLPQTFE